MTLAQPAAAAPAAAASANEQVIWEGVPSMKMMVAEIVGAVLVVAVLVVAAILLFDPVLSAVGGLNHDIADLIDEQRANIRLVVTVVVAAAVALRLAKVAWHTAILRSHRYKVTNQRIIVEMGVLSKRLAEVDMRTVEDVQLSQPILQRLFGIGEIGIACADRQMGRFRLLGVESPRDVREQIRAAAFQSTQRQLFMRGT
jgi:uncharacterized membrane protein YdbT with pleckstrin-like domain